MKVLHVPYSFPPDLPGGTEVYVAALAREMSRRGTDSVVAAPTSAPGSPSYSVDGVRVHRFSLPDSEPSLPVLYGARDDKRLAALMTVVNAESPDIVHFHSYTPAMNGVAAAQVRASGRGVVVTYHTPSVTCQRGTLLRFGRIVCDGKLIKRRCAACVLQQHGVPRPAADAMAYVPDVVGEGLQSLGVRGGVWTGLQMPNLMRIRHEDTRRFLNAADAIVAVASWVHALLVRNGIDPDKIFVSPQGVDLPSARAQRKSTRTGLEGRTVRAVILSRIDPIKGLHLPLEALGHRPDLDISLDIYGTVQGEDEYVAGIRRSVSNDPRVRLLPAVAPMDVIEVIASYDVMLVPSQVLETGPLVLLEAQAAGVPVIGTSLGSLVERLRDGIDGELVAAGSVRAWEAALVSLASDPSRLERWRAALAQPRSMADVADDMDVVYNRVMLRSASRRSLGE